MKLGWDIVAGAHSGGRFFLGERPYVCDVYFANLSKWWKMREYLRARHPASATPWSASTPSRSGPCVATTLVMNAPVRLLAAALAAAMLSAAAPAAAQVSVTLFAGYGGTSGIDNATTNAQRRRRIGRRVRRRRRLPMDASRELKLLYSQQSTTLAPGGGAAPFDLTIRYLHIGGSLFVEGAVGQRLLRRRRGRHDAVQPGHERLRQRGTSRRAISASATGFRSGRAWRCRSRRAGYFDARQQLRRIPLLGRLRRRPQEPTR